jgi:hypothetical protein
MEGVCPWITRVLHDKGLTVLHCIVQHCCATIGSVVCAIQEGREAVAETYDHNMASGYKNACEQGQTMRIMTDKQNDSKTS